MLYWDLLTAFESFLQRWTIFDMLLVDQLQDPNKLCEPWKLNARK